MARIIMYLIGASCVAVIGWQFIVDIGRRRYRKRLEQKRKLIAAAREDVAYNRRRYDIKDIRQPITMEEDNAGQE